MAISRLPGSQASWENILSVFFFFFTSKVVGLAGLRTVEKAYNLVYYFFSVRLSLFLTDEAIHYTYNHWKIGTA